jgi:hypothetical protein
VSEGVCSHGRPDHIELIQRLRAELGMFAGAMPISPKEAFEQALAQIEDLRSAATRLLDNVSPFISALEVEHDADGEELYADLAQALRLPRDYGSDSWRARQADSPRPQGDE